MIDFTLYPNLNGQLGQNKVAIPDGVNTFWPDGDALVGNFVYKDGKLTGFVDTKALISNDSKTTTIPYDYVNIHLENIKEGEVSFNLSDRTKYFTVTYGSGNSDEVIVLGTKYVNCTTISQVKQVDSKYTTNDIIDGVWNESLENLTNSSNMFQVCSNLVTFNSDLSSLINGSGMFFGCLNLTSFNANLKSLTNGYFMFRGCKLGADSISRIAKSIKDVNGLEDMGNPTENIFKSLYIGASNPETCDEYFTQIHNKGWQVFVNDSPAYTPATVTLEETGEITSTPISFWAKPVPTTEESAEYVDSEGNYFIILGGNYIYVNDPESYGMFTSEEDAAMQMRLTRIEKE